MFLCRSVTQMAPSGRDETSLVMSCPNRPGAVYQLLEPFAKYGVSMSRFESRPARTGRWEYLFFVDLVGHRSEEARAIADRAGRHRVVIVKRQGEIGARKPREQAVAQHRLRAASTFLGGLAD